MSGKTTKIVFEIVAEMEWASLVNYITQRRGMLEVKEDPKTGEWARVKLVNLEQN